MKLPDGKYEPKHSIDLCNYARGWNVVIEHIVKEGYVESYEEVCLLKIMKTACKKLDDSYYKGIYDCIDEIERLNITCQQKKALLVTDALMVDGKYICYDEEQSCPIWNKEEWCCEYKRNSKTKDCPLKPIPKNQVEQKYDIAREYDQYYIDEWATGYNDCINDLLKE